MNMWNAVWQIFAMTVVLLVVGFVFWDQFPRGHRSRRSLALGYAAAAVVVAGGIAHASYGGPRGLLISVCGLGLFEIARRTDLPIDRHGDAPGPDEEHSGRR